GALSFLHHLFRVCPARAFAHPTERDSISSRSALPRDPVQYLLGNAHHVFLAIGPVRRRFYTRAAPIDALEVGLAFVKAEARARRLVNKFVFSNFELIGHNRHRHVLSFAELSSRPSAADFKFLQWLQQ